MLGWTLGLGGELALSQAVSGAIEYRHSDFGNSTFNFSNPMSPQVLGIRDDRTILRLNYRFYRS